MAIISEDNLQEHLGPFDATKEVAKEQDAEGWFFQQVSSGKTAMAYTADLFIVRLPSGHDVSFDTLRKLHEKGAKDISVSATNDHDFGYVVITVKR